MTEIPVRKGGYIMNMNIIEAFKRGDRAGLQFEGKQMWLDIPEWRIQLALKSSQGSDESSIVDCFLGYVAKHPWNGDLDSWLWGWLVYHQQHHGRGYGRTYRDHFSLISFLNKRRPEFTVTQKLAKVREIADDADSFGNASLALPYPLYQYARGSITEYTAREVVLWFTRHSHANDDALKAVSRLLDAIDGNKITSPGEDVIRRNHCAAQATAWNTLMTAAFIADVETEDELFRRGIWVGGDADSTMATAALLWALGRHESEDTGHPLRDAVTSMFWLPFAAGKQIPLTEDFTLEFKERRHLALFLSGEDQAEYRDTEKIVITPHTILMGSLLGYTDYIFGIEDMDLERVFLADTIRDLTKYVFKKDDPGGFLLDAAHWLRAHVSLTHGWTALKTAMRLAPFHTGIRIDYICMCWYRAEDEQDENGRRELLEEIVATYQQLNPGELPEQFLERTSYFFCASLGMLGRHTQPGDREWYSHASGYVEHPFALERLKDSLLGGFSMEVCRTSVKSEQP